jgi:hypothetical protein
MSAKPCPGNVGSGTSRAMDITLVGFWPTSTLVGGPRWTRTTYLRGSVASPLCFDER